MSKTSAIKTTPRKSWTGSNSSISYRASTWPALDPTSKRVNGAHSSKSDSSEFDETTSEIHFHPKAALEPLFAAISNPGFILHIWSLSLVGSATRLTAQSLLPLSNIAALGFLDLSRTDVTLKALQTAIRPIQILRLHLFHCRNLTRLLTTIQPTLYEANFETPLSNATYPGGLQVKGVGADASLSSVTEEDMRGFLVFVMPNVWTLDGLPVLFQERHFWEKHFSDGGRGQFTDLMRKNFVAFETYFSPRKKTTYPNGSALKAEYVYESAASKKIWSPIAKKHLASMPSHFNMPVDQDLWRLKRLANDFEFRAMSQFPESVFSFSQIRGSVAAFLGIPTSHSPTIDPSHFATAYNLNCKIVLSMFLVCSLMENVPTPLLQATLESVFEANDASDGRRKQHWAQRPVSPLLWCIQERLEYLGLLIAGIEMDLNKLKRERSKDSQTLSALGDMLNNDARVETLTKRSMSFRPTLSLLLNVLYTSKTNNPAWSSSKSSAISVSAIQQQDSFSFSSFTVAHPPPSKPTHPTTPPLISNSALHHLISKNPNLRHRFAANPSSPSLSSTTLLHLHILQIETLPFLMCSKTESITHGAAEFIDQFLHLQEGMLKPIAGHIVHSVALFERQNACHGSPLWDVYESLATATMRSRRGRSRSRSRTRSQRALDDVGTFKAAGGPLSKLHVLLERAFEISESGVMGVDEIRVWEVRSQQGISESPVGDNDSTHEREGEGGSEQFASTLEGLAFQIKLKVLSAVDDLLELIQGTLVASSGISSEGPEAWGGLQGCNGRGKESEPTRQDPPVDADEEMQVFELLRRLRISRHSRDPVPSSLILNGKPALSK
ncbi:hypothetical protein BJ741DRAFT_627704 [Chytriomyces cf. hyalinus JEL632]|nr:hypothetical protein BJ741DRAFT_627704 [Chytriomyces cf. hyalinus JEL632]